MHASLALVLALSATCITAKPAGHRYIHKRQNGNQAVLDADNIQIGSTIDGTTSLGFNVAAQKPSLTDPANFINFCSGKTKTNGLQILTGSCNGVVMGDLPAKDSMVSAMITFPEPGAGSNLQANQDFAVTIQMSNLVAGFFTNAVATYYTVPQTLVGGKVQGHTHITIEDMGGSLTPSKALNPTTFVFFKGVDDNGDGNGKLTANVTGGLPGGNYRVCSITTTSNHAAVNMPVAQRGAVDDCTKFTVGGTGGTKNNAASDGAGGIAAAKAAADAVAAGPGALDPNAGASASASASESAVGGGQANSTAAADTQTASGTDSASTGGADASKTAKSGAASSGASSSGALSSGASSSAAGDAASSAASASTTGQSAGASASATATTATGSVTSAAGASASSAKSSASASASASASGSATSAAGAAVPSDSSAVGGIGAPPVNNSGDPSRPFACDGNTFVNKAAAKQRSCDRQFNACANAANAGRGRFSVGDCQGQQTRCNRG